jgi:hypothetical protein
MALQTYGVCGDVDILLLAVGYQVVLSEKRVTLDLVCSGDYAGTFDDCFKLRYINMRFTFCSI